MKKLFCYLLMLPLLCALAACGEDEPNPDNPEETVPDPAGTITLKMRYDGDTSIDDIIKIDDSYNFYGWSQGSVQFVSVGQCKGLGNVTRIPKTGWASSVAVTPGCGYVAYVPSSNSFYRLYVAGTMTGTDNGIIGYTVKYQTPFSGADEELKLEKTSLSFDKDGGGESVKVLNESVILFSVKSTVSWIHASPASTGVSFLNDAIFIQVDPAGRGSSEGIVRVTYGKNKSVDIKVTRPVTPFIDLGRDNWSFSPEGGEVSVPVQSNLELAKLKIEFGQDDAEWLVAGLETTPKTSLSRLKYIGGQPAAEVLKTAVESKVNSYSLRLKASPNIGVNKRSATLWIDGGDALSQLFLVAQNGGSLSFAAPEVWLGQGATTQEVSVNAVNIDLNKLTVSVKDKWCRAILDAKASAMKIVVDANDSQNDRQTLVSLLNSSGESVAELKVGQIGRRVKLDMKTAYFDRKLGTQSIGILMPDDVGQTVVKCSADWVTATLSADKRQLVVRVTEAQANRVATVSFTGFSEKLEIRQSKYAVGDVYNENGVEGRVFVVESGVGKIYKTIGGTFAWSVENVFLGATDREDGRKNMEIVKAQPNWQTLYPAFAAVEALNVGGVSGWYLPAVDEFFLEKVGLYYEYQVLYLTSTEISENRNNIFKFNMDWKVEILDDFKSQQYPVVAIRRFEY